MDEALLHRLRATNNLSEKAALVAESILSGLPDRLALLARRCVVFHWFDLSVARELLRDLSLSEEELQDTYQQLLSLPFIEVLSWGNAFQSLTREGLIRYYVQTQPELLKTSARLAMSIYASRGTTDKLVAEALFCSLIAEDHDTYRTLLASLLKHASSQEDWQYIHELFALREEVKRLSFVPLFPLSERQELLKDLIHAVLAIQNDIAVFHMNDSPLISKLLKQVNQGTGSAFKGKLERAQRSYKRALGLNSRVAPLQVAKGIVALAQEDYPQALQDFNRALKFDPDNFFFLRQQGVALEGCEKLAEALTVYESLLSLDANPAFVYRKMGDILVRLEKYEDALAVYNQSIFLDNYDAEAYSGKSVALSRLSLYVEAQIARESAERLGFTFHEETEIADISSVQKDKREQEHLSLFSSTEEATESPGKSSLSSRWVPSRRSSLNRRSLQNKPKSFQLFRERGLAGVAVAVLLVVSIVLFSHLRQGTLATLSQPIKGGTWVDDVPAAPGSLLPQGSDITYSVLIDQAIYTPLFYGDALGHIYPGLAVDIPTVANGEASSDLKTWIFKLKPNLKWSDGQPLNADDLAYSFQVYNAPTFGAKFTTGFADIVSTTVSPDKLSITMHLDKPIGNFVSNFVDANPGAPLPMHRFSSMKPGDILKSPDSLLPTVTNGPFMIKADESTDQQKYTVVPNPYYYQPSLPYLNKIVFNIVNDPDTILKDAQNGAITSSWFLDISNISTYKAIAGYTVAPDQVSAAYEALWMNENNPALKDVKVRQAMAMAIDHQKLIAVARNGFATPLCTDHPASLVPGYQADAPCPTFDPAAANALLDQAGWAKGSDGVRSKNGVRLDFKYTTTTLVWRKTDQALVQQQLQNIGIKTTLVNQPGSTFFGQTLPQGEPGVYDIGEFEQVYSYDADDSSTLDCASIPSAANSYGGQNYAFYCNHDLDALFNQELGTTDPAVRQDAFNKIHQIELIDFPFITEYAPVNATIVKNTAHNDVSGPMGAQETVNVWNWWCTGGQC